MAAAAGLVLILAEGRPTEHDLQSRAGLDDDVAEWLREVGDYWPLEEQGALVARELCVKVASAHLDPTDAK